MASISEKLNKWAILCVQDPVFLESVKIAYVYDNGNQAIIVTRDDDVYAIGMCDIHISGSIYQIVVFVNSIVFILL